MRNLTWTRQPYSSLEPGRVEYVAHDRDFTFTVHRAYGYNEREWDMGVHRATGDGECVTIMQGFASLREAKAEAAEFSW